MHGSTRARMMATAAVLVAASALATAPAFGATPSPTATATATPVPTATAGPTSTPVPTVGPTSAPVPTSTSVPTTTATPVPVPTATPAPTTTPSANPVPSAAPTTPAAPDSTRVYLVGSPSESFADQVARSIAANPASAGTWTDVLGALRARVQASGSVDLPGDATSSGAQLVQIGQALVGAQRTAATVRPGAVGAPDAVVPDSTTYELRGYAINSNVTWEVKTEIDGAFCDIIDGCETTDVTRQTWKVTPGRTGDRFSFTSIRNGSGNLTQIYANLSVVCGSTVCGTGSAGKSGPEDGSGSGSPTVVHTSNAGGLQVDRIQMHAHFVPSGGTYYDSVKTGTAKCGTGSTYSCKY